MSKGASSNKRIKKLAKKLNLQIEVLQKELKDTYGLIESLSDAIKAADSLGELALQELQQLTDQKSQLETMLANVMKAASDTTSSIVSAIKAS